jgi:hypothetical protein
MTSQALESSRWTTVNPCTAHPIAAHTTVCVCRCWRRLLPPPPRAQEFLGWCERLFGYLQVLENRLFSEGLHVLGAPPSNTQMAQYLEVRTLLFMGGPGLRAGVAAHPAAWIHLCMAKAGVGPSTGGHDLRHADAPTLLAGSDPNPLLSYCTCVPLPTHRLTMVTACPLRLCRPHSSVHTAG